MKESKVLIDEITEQMEKSVDKQVDQLMKSHKLDEDQREALKSMVLLHRLHPEIYDKKNLDDDLYVYIKDIDALSNLRLQKGLLDLAKRRAKGVHKPLNRYIRECLELAIGLKPKTWKNLDTLTNYYGLTPAELIGRLISEEMADFLLKIGEEKS